VRSAGRVQRTRAKEQGVSDELTMPEANTPSRFGASALHAFTALPSSLSLLARSPARGSLLCI
jgi:hypothetical protein